MMIIDQLLVLKYGLFALGFYWASMSICSLGSLLIWFSAKDRTFLYLSLFIFLMSLITPFGPTSTGPDLSSPSYTLHFQVFALFSMVTNNVLYKFIEHFYKLKEYSPSFNRLLRLPIYFGWAALPFIFIYPSRQIYVILTINILFLTFLVIYLFIKETLRDHTNSWMAFGNIFFQISIAIYLSNSVHFMYSNLIFLVLAGGFIQALFFIIASWIRYEKSRHSLERLSKIALLGEISSGIAHEIRTPLSIASAKLELANNMIPDSVDLKQYILSAESKVNQAISMITRIQKFGSKKTNDKSQYANANLVDLVQDALDLCAVKIKYNSITVKKNLPEDIFLCCPPNDIIQVLANLINNSCDAIRNLESKWIEIESSKDERWILIKVTDSGSGISKQLQNKIFESFFTTKPDNLGTGLGLSISKKIIDDLDGVLYVNNDSPYTQFVIELPHL